MSWLSRLVTRLLDRHDPAARTTGVRYTTDRTYLYANAQKSAKRALSQSATGRKWAKPKAKAAKTPATVTPIRRAK